MCLTLVVVLFSHLCFSNTITPEIDGIDEVLLTEEKVRNFQNINWTIHRNFETIA